MSEPDAPWRPSTAQAAYLRALVAPGTDALAAWTRAQQAGNPPPEVVPLLASAYPRLASLDIDAPVVDTARAEYLHHVQGNLVRTARLLAILERFERAGIPALVLKGAALNQAYYRTQGERGMADVDLLVQPHDVPGACEQLAPLGWMPGGDTTPLAQHARLRVHHALTFAASPLLSLDLHWRAGPGLSSERFRALWDRRETLWVEGIPFHVPGREDLLHHVLVHAVQPSWQPSPRWLLDAWKVLTDATRPPVNWADLVATATALSTSVRVTEGLRTVRTIGPWLVPDRVVSDLAEHARDGWEWREAALYARMPPYASRDILRWHWYLFRRLRAADPVWRDTTSVAGFAAYVRLRWRLRRGTTAGLTGPASA